MIRPLFFEIYHKMSRRKGRKKRFCLTRTKRMDTMGQQMR